MQLANTLGCKQKLETHDNEEQRWSSHHRISIITASVWFTAPSRPTAPAFIYTQATDVT